MDTNLHLKEGSTYLQEERDPLVVHLAPSDATGELLTDIPQPS